MMEWNNPLQNDEEYQAALDRLWEVFFAEPGTPEGNEHALLADLIEAYAELHYPIGPPTDPVAVIEFWMDQKDLTQADLVPCIGSRDAVAEVLSYQRPVTPQMAQALERLFRLEPGHIPLKPVVSNPIPPVNRV
jgi:HTH-type transcriptional regulator/antitoxin HigA